MAIDTAKKRRNASQIISGLFGPGVTPNSNKDKAWRYEVGWCYLIFAVLTKQIEVTLRFTENFTKTLEFTENEQKILKFTDIHSKTTVFGN